MNLILFSLIIGIASVVQGITGFGYATIAMPILIWFVDKETIVVAMSIISIILNLYLTNSIKAETKKVDLKVILFAFFLGLPLGIFLIKAIPIDGFKVAVGIMSIACAILVINKKFTIPSNKITEVVVGFIAGIMQTSINMNGPLMVVYLLGRKLKKDETRKVLSNFFLIAAVLTVLMFLAFKMLSWNRIVYGLTAAPCVILGGLIGNKLVQKISNENFIKITVGVVIASGIYSIAAVLI
jgi:uncharacterized membrane protein YfcA